MHAMSLRSAAQPRPHDGARPRRARPELTEHDGGPRHPERPARLVAVMEGVRALGPEQEIVAARLRRGADGGAGPRARPGLPDAAGGVLRGGRRRHRRRHLRVGRLVGGGPARRRRRPGRAATSSKQRGEGMAFVPVRPPGHHATGDRAMGFCLVNNVAVAAASRTALGRTGADRRLGRAPRERHPGHLLGRPRRALRLDPPAPALPGDRASRRGRRCGARRD